MGRKKKNTVVYTKLKDNDGNVYPWTDERYVLYHAMDNMKQAAKMFQTDKEMASINNAHGKLEDEIDNFCNDNFGHLHDGVHSSNEDTSTFIILPNGSKLHSRYLDDQIKDAEKIMKKIVKQISNKRNAFSAPKYARVLQHLDSMIEIFGVENGNLVEAIVKEPYIENMRVFMSGMPLGTFLKRDQMDQAMKGLGDFYDLYMDVTENSFDEIRLQYERQEMERTGMNSLKEQIYKEKMYKTHQKFIEDFEKVIALGDTSKYDKFLNNDAEQTFRRSMGSRDVNGAVGTMRGEMRAIENGWRYDELTILGMIGCLEESIKATIRDNEPDKIKDIQPVLEDLTKDIESIKKDIWDKKDPTAAEKLEVTNNLIKLADKINPMSNEVKTYVHSDLVFWKENMQQIAKRLEEEKIIEELKFKDVPGTYLKSILDRKGMRSFVEEMVAFTRRQGEITAKGDNATEAEKTWIELFQSYQNGLTENMTADQLVSYFKTLNEYQADLQAQFGSEAEKVEKDIEEGKVEGIGEFKNDPMVKGLIAERIALRNSHTGSKLESVTDLINGYRMEFEGNGLTPEQKAAIGDNSVNDLTQLFSDKAKKDYINEKAGDNEFRLTYLMSRGYDINGKKGFIEGYGIKENEDGKFVIKNQELFNAKLKENLKQGYDRISDYEQKLTDIVNKAGKNLIEISGMKVKPDKDSEEFTNMREALIKVSGLNMNNTPEEINQALYDLKLASEDYTKNRVNSARNRRDMAKKLTDFANENLVGFMDNVGRSININEPLSAQYSEIYKAGVQNEIDGLDAGNSEQALTFADELKQRADSLRNDENNMKINEASDSKQFTAMRKAVENLQKIGRNSTPKDISNALDELRKTSSAYIAKIKVEGGGKSINGGRRLDHANALFEYSVSKSAEFDNIVKGKLDVSKAISSQAGGNLINNNLIENDQIENNVIENNIIRQHTNVKELLEDEGEKKNIKTVGKVTTNEKIKEEKTK